MTDRFARTPYCTKIRYGITGAPILTEDELDGSYAPGIGVRPTLIELVYSAARDGKPARISASVTGTWTRFGEPADGQMTTHFDNGPDGWPDWLAEEARRHDPDAEQAEARERYMAGLRRADEMNDQLMEEVQRYAEGTEHPVLWSVYNAMHKRALTAEARAEAMERAMESTAADALKHRGCHRDLMAQCLRAEQAEARVAELEQQAAAPAVDRAALRDRIAAAIWERQNPGRRWADCEYRWRADAEADADAVLAVLPPPVSRAAVYREAADALGRMDYDTDSNDYGYDTYRDAWNGGVMDGAEELRRLADETPDTEPDATDAQHMLTRMQANAVTHDYDHLLRLIARWTASSEGRDVLVQDLIQAGYRLSHACGNCEGIDPDTCLKNPDRPAAGARQDGATP